MAMQVYKTEINPTDEQIAKILQTIGVCRFVYNLFIQVNKERHEAGAKYMGGYEFSKWLNNEYRFAHPEHSWIKEFGYIPVGFNVKSVTIKIRAGKFFVCCLVEVPNFELPKAANEPIGIDLGINQFAWTSEEKTFPNVNKTPRIRKLKKKLKREQRRFSRKIEHRKKVKNATEKSANLNKQRKKVQKTFYRLDCIRKDYINKIVSELVKTKPVYIVIEDLNVSGMMKNKHLSRAISEQDFYYFRSHLETKCKESGIELRIADRFFASSKICSACGCKKTDLKLKDRTYSCPSCGLEIDRDLNASLNLKHCQQYKIA